LTEELDTEKLELLKKSIQENLLVVLLGTLIDSKLPINCGGYGATILSYYETNPALGGFKEVVCKIEIPYIQEKMDILIQLPKITFPASNNTRIQEESK